MRNAPSRRQRKSRSTVICWTDRDVTDDDRAAADLAHLGDRILDAEKDAAQQNRVGAVPTLGGDLLERTDRPEDERVFGDPFRTVRPLLESSIIGITRWFVTTGGYGRGLTPDRLPVHVEGIAEVEYAHVSKVMGLLDPTSFYGRNDLWMFSVALRFTAGAPMHRMMGRYGVAGAAGHDMPRMPQDGME